MNLVSVKTKSQQYAFKKGDRRGEHLKKHGYAAKERLYRIWKAMRTRCNNPNFFAYEYYGGKGIEVCSEWDNYLNFRNWAMGNGYDNNLTIDRIDTNKGYYPENCRWATREEQVNNQTSNINIEYEGKEYTPKEISELTGIKVDAVYVRIERGWTNKEIVTIPKGGRRKKAPKNAKLYEHNGMLKTLKELSKISGIKEATLRHRIDKKRLSPEKAMNIKVNKFY